MSGRMNIEAKQKKWQDPSKFNIEITGPGTNILNLPDSSTLSLACQGIQLADINSAPIEDYIGEEWRFAIGRLENYQVAITFKDYDNFILYKKFANAIQKFVRMYPDEQKINIKINTSDDFSVDNFLPTVEFINCIIISVSGSGLDNSAIASVAEFTVTMKCSYVKTF